MSSINNVNLNTGEGIISIALGPDEEHKKIMRRLEAYGIRPTGNKTADFNLLRHIELKLAQLEDCVSSKFLTVSKNEQDKIQAKKEQKRKENNPELDLNSENAQKLFGEQIYLVICMKNKKY